ncbi:MAG: hypothetical protein ACLQGP_01645 [Isosphaeraceae bacterium]
MQDTNDPHPLHEDPSWAACLHRTRSAVLNVLIGVGLTIAVGGWLLRGRAEPAQPPKSQRVHDILMAALLFLGVASYVVRRLTRSLSAATVPGRRQSAFYWSHVMSATIVALAAPLGIVYGWWIDPRLEAVIPFWVVPLAMGFLAIPRRRELADFDRSSTNLGAPLS